MEKNEKVFMKENCCKVNYKWVITQNQILDLSNYSNKNKLDHAKGIDASDLAAEKEFVTLKAEVGKIDIWLIFQLVWIILFKK